MSATQRSPTALSSVSMVAKQRLASGSSTMAPVEEHSSPRRFRARSSSRQDCALSRTPSVRPTSSFLPSGVAPRHCAASSRRPAHECRRPRVDVAFGREIALAPPCRCSCDPAEESGPYPRRALPSYMNVIGLGPRIYPPSPPRPRASTMRWKRRGKPTSISRSSTLISRGGLSRRCRCPRRPPHTVRLRHGLRRPRAARLSRLADPEEAIPDRCAKARVARAAKQALACL